MRARAKAPWWRDAVIYQVYPRSFADSGGDGVGDLAGIGAHLDHLEWLGVDALWLSPVYPSGAADGGYDLTELTAIDPVYGTLGELDALIEDCHRRGLRLLMDLVVSHTSIDHPWFREHPDYYVWADGGPPNNWRAAFGGSAWSRDDRSGCWYLHSHYPEQPDLDWRNPRVREQIAAVVRFWRERGVDGFRVDAMQGLIKDAELRDDPPAAGPPALPLHPDLALYDPVHSRNDPEVAIALDALREAAGDSLLVGEVYLPTAMLGAYLGHLDLAFAFELLHSRWEAEPIRGAIEAAAATGSAAWVLSNHDFARLATRFGDGAVRAAAILLLTLPGCAFVYQGDELGMVDGGEAEPPDDRAGRDAHRHPMQWDASPGAGFSDGVAWLAPTDPAARNVADQRADRGSVMWLYRELIALRAGLGAGLRMLDSPEATLAYMRGETHGVELNLGSTEVTPSVHGEPVLATDPGSDRLSPGGGRIVRVAGR